MSKFADPDHLKNQQYRDAGNLNARIQLHARFKTNPYDWFAWVFDHFDLPAEAKLLELGTGPAMLWRSNLQRIPPAWEITLSDLSPGMVEAARQELKEAAGRFRYEVMDAQSIPLADASLDAVVANHMLYHVPDRPRALAEIRRVLKPGGFLFAATNGDRHMQTIDRLAGQLFLPLTEMRRQNFGPAQFTLENGGAQLAPYFTAIQIDHYLDSLRVTEAEPLVAYILSMGSLPEINATPTDLERFRSALQAEIDRHGAINIEKSTGLFIAQKAT